MDGLFIIGAIWFICAAIKEAFTPRWTKDQAIEHMAKKVPQHDKEQFMREMHHSKYK